MCIAIARPAGQIIKKETLKYCFKQNPHGVGFAIPSASGKYVTIKKGFFTFRSFWRAYREYKDLGRPMIIHFRVSTSGEVNGDNCHPWYINGQTALIHNGVLEHKLGLTHENFSDTGLFTANVIRPIFKDNPNLWKNPAFKWSLEESIGEKNKIVILDNNGDFIIFNEKQGEWHEGCWFSNTTYKEERKKYTYKPTYTPGVHLEKREVLLLPPPREKDIVYKLPPPKPVAKNTIAKNLTTNANSVNLNGPAKEKIMDFSNLA